jgi:hypothetical protein
MHITCEDSGRSGGGIGVVIDHDGTWFRACLAYLACASALMWILSEEPVWGLEYRGSGQ